MKTYYIYHISGIKIGCTSRLNDRVLEQGYSNFEVLEEHEDIYVASDRELELQKEYGYPIDTMPYWQSVERMLKAQSNAASKGGKASCISRRKLTMEQAREIRAKYVPHKYSLNKLAKEYNVAKGNICNIINNETYREDVV